MLIPEQGPVGLTPMVTQCLKTPHPSRKAPQSYQMGFSGGHILSNVPMWSDIPPTCTPWVTHRALFERPPMMILKLILSARTCLPNSIQSMCGLQVVCPPEQDNRRHRVSQPQLLRQSCTSQRPTPLVLLHIQSQQNISNRLHLQNIPRTWPLLIAPTVCPQLGQANLSGVDYWKNFQTAILTHPFLSVSLFSLFLM